MYSKENALTTAYNDVVLFNDVAGAEPNLDTMRNKTLRVLEEVKETLEAIDKRDDKEILDGVVDVLYTAFGLIKPMEQMGFDVMGALTAVCQNNASKLIPADNVDEIINTVKMYKKAGVETVVSVHEPSGRCAVKNKSEGKVLKPFSYKSVNLSTYLPRKD